MHPLGRPRVAYVPGQQPVTLAELRRAVPQTFDDIGEDLLGVHRRVGREMPRGGKP